jgi:hypothetical protein
MNERPQDKGALAGRIAAELARIRPGLRAEEIGDSASLTQDLGLGSLELANLFAFVKAHIANVDLTPWLLSAARKGTDSVGSLALFLASARDVAA